MIKMKIQEESQRGGIPGKHIIHGLMIFAGGLLLLTPGFVTDITGFCLVMPGPRHFLMVFVRKLVEEAIKNGNFQFQSYGGGSFSGGSFGGGFQQQQRPDMNFEQRDFHQESRSEQVSADFFEAEFERKE